VVIEVTVYVRCWYEALVPSRPADTRPAVSLVLLHDRELLSLGHRYRPLIRRCNQNSNQYYASEIWFYINEN